MSPADAAQILDVPANASPEQLEARFHELRTKLEDKIAKAPTPGLKAKYRETLEEITTAFETLTLAADSSSLPVTSKQGAGSKEQGVQSSRSEELRSSLATSSPLPAPSSARRKSGGKEFAIVAVIAIALLGAGGWFVMKTRAENAEKARLAAEAQAEAARRIAEAQAEAQRQAAAAKADQERLAEVARLDAERKRQAEEAERVRLEKLSAQLRADLAEAKVSWEAIEREERTAERRLTELRSDLRSMRDQPAGRQAEAQALASAQQDYYTWLSDTLARHPARIARTRAEELLSARQPDDARAAVQEFAASLRTLEQEIPRQRSTLLDLDGEFALKTNPDATWSLTDAFGRTRAGKGPVEFKDVAIGRAEVRISKNGWPARAESVQIKRSEITALDAVFEGTDLRLNSVPAGATAFTPDGREVGVTPIQLTDLAPGNYELRLKLPGHYDQRVFFSTPESSGDLNPVKLRPRATKPVKPDWRLPAHFIYETTSTWTTDANRSTGTFAKDAPSYYNHSSNSSKEEWWFSRPDTNGQWTRAERRVISNSSPLVPVGLTIRYDRQPDGKFTAAILQGSVSNETIRNAYLNYPGGDPTWGNGWLTGAWPTEDTPVGGTWTFNNTTGIPSIFGANAATGKLVAFDRTPTADWVTLQFSNDKVTKGDAETRAANTVTLRINLGEGYIASIDGTSLNSTTVKAVLIGQIGTDTRGNYRYTMTVLD